MGNVYLYWFRIWHTIQVNCTSIWTAQLISWNTYFADLGTSILRFQNDAELLKVDNKPQFSVILTAITCLNIIVESNGDEVSELIDMFNQLEVKKKYLQFIIPSLNETLLQNKTINSNVMFYHKGSG